MLPTPPPQITVTELYDRDRVEIRSTVDPVSLQASTRRKRSFRKMLSAAVRDSTKGVFVHDVQVVFVWSISEERRYQTHLVADLDNVLKPVMDAVTGRDGILIDDNQVQIIQASWAAPGVHGPGFEVGFSSIMRDEYILREGLSFVEFSAGRCYPLPGVTESERVLLAKAYANKVSGYFELQALGASEAIARGVLPVARPFPRARLGKYTIHKYSDLCEKGPTAE